jgi:hypothetical protein
MYNNLPYLNVKNGDSIILNDLFSYEKLTIPPSGAAPASDAAPASGGAPEPEPDYHILNIKKQFICVTTDGEKSELYVKKPTIEGNKLTLIKTSEEKNQFDDELDKTVDNLKTVPDGTGIDLFNVVYKKINTEEMPFFSLNSTSYQGQGGKKGGGTRKTQGGSRSR